MLKVNEILDRASKTAGSIASIMLSLAVTAFAASSVKKSLVKIFKKPEAKKVEVEVSTKEEVKKAAKTSKAKDTKEAK